MNKPLLGHWRHGDGNICCGTLRIAKANFDTDPTPELQTEILDWICKKLNQSDILEWMLAHPGRISHEANNFGGGTTFATIGPDGQMKYFSTMLDAVIFAMNISDAEYTQIVSDKLIDLLSRKND